MGAAEPPRGLYHRTPSDAATPVNQRLTASRCHAEKRAGLFFATAQAKADSQGRAPSVHFVAVPATPMPYALATRVQRRK